MKAFKLNVDGIDCLLLITDLEKIKEIEETIKNEPMPDEVSEIPLLTVFDQVQQALKEQGQIT